MQHANGKKPTEIAGIVAALMSHYWTSDELMAQRESQITDWIADLIEYPVGLIEAACTEWRRSQTRRPTPADIRALCRESAPTGNLIVDHGEYRRQIGWENDAQRYDAIRANAWRYERAEQWRSTGIDPGPEPSFDWLEEYRP